jgi:hypothetical protein
MLAVTLLAHALSSSSECHNAGFLEDAPCSGCVKMGLYITDQSLVRLCESCCFEDKVDSKYPNAVLRVCR